jgi:hypothetical protein
MVGAVQGRPDQLGHARVQDDDRRVALPDVQHATDDPAATGHDCPAGLDGETGGTGARGEIGDLGRGLLGEPPNLWDGVGVVRGHREAAADVERVEVRQGSALELEHAQRDAHCRTPRVDGTELRPDVDVEAAPP